MAHSTTSRALRILSWNVNGLRSILQKGLRQTIADRQPDIICLQEIKIGADEFAKLTPVIPGYVAQASHADRPGYSGVATFIREELSPQFEFSHRLGTRPSDFSREGRILVASGPWFDLYNLYFPSGTSGPERQAFKYRFLEHFESHLTHLPQRARDRVIVCGDFNICHKPEDIHHPVEATRRQLTGFLPDERAWIDRFVQTGFTDSFRRMNPDARGIYSWWTYRAGARKKNLGWRIDYLFVSHALSDRITEAQLLTKVSGSDHCPAELALLPEESRTPSSS